MNAATLLMMVSLAAPTPEVSQSSDEKSIQGLVDGFRLAIEKADAAALEKLFWPDAVIFDQGEPEEDPRYFSAHVVAKLKPAGVRWKDEKNAGRAEGSMAYVAQRAILERSSDGGTVRELHHFTFLVRKKEGVWKISHFHWSRGWH